MCGIVGVAGDVSFKEEKVLKTLLIVDSLRGIDSTGAAFVDNGLDVAITKQVGDPYVLMDSAAFNKAMGRKNVAIIGHNRYATQGVVSRKNAHPFEFNEIVGVHNGTLNNKYRLDDAQKFTVDSENLFYHMDKHGVEDTIPIVQGAWSLVWWNKNTQTLNFLRNKERPMFHAFSKNGKTLFWASEAWMLNIAAYRAEVELGKVEETPIDSLLTYSLDAAGNISLDDVKTIKGGEPVVFQGGAGFSKTSNLALPRPNNTSTTPTGRVIHFPKKEEAADIPVEYIGMKQRTLEVFAGGVDEHGARYLTCFDAEYPTAHCRLYVNMRDNNLNLIGKEILADIGKLYKGQHRSFFKVDYGSVRLKKADIVYKTNKGDECTKEHWEREYGMCCWCSAPIFPTDKFTFIKEGGGALCEDCSNDPEVKQYL